MTCLRIFYIENTVRFDTGFELCGSGAGRHKKIEHLLVQMLYFKLTITAYENDSNVISTNRINITAK